MAPRLPSTLPRVNATPVASVRRPAGETSTIRICPSPSGEALVTTAGADHLDRGGDHRQRIRRATVTGGHAVGVAATRQDEGVPPPERSRRSHRNGDGLRRRSENHQTPGDGDGSNRAWTTVRTRRMTTSFLEHSGN